MPKGQQAPLEERIEKQLAKLEKTKKAYEQAKAEMEKLQAEANAILLKEIAIYAAQHNMTVSEYLKSVKPSTAKPEK